MVLLDLTSIEEPYLDPEIHVVDALLYRGKARQVDTVIINGEVILRDGRFTKIDKSEIVSQLKERFARPLEAPVLEARQMVRRLQPYVERFYQSWHPGEAPPHYVYNSRG